MMRALVHAVFAVVVPWAVPWAILTVAPAAWAQAAAEPAGFWQQDTLTGDWGGLRGKLADHGIVFNLQEQSELWGNMAGGIRTGATYDGLTTASIQVDLDKLAGWTGGTFFVSAYQIHGRGPSANLVGNQQIVSSLEATRDTKLYALWLEQKLFDGRLVIRLGQEGANDQMMVSQYAALFVNSSFGFPGLSASDLPSGGPNYPMATPFIRVEYHPTGQLTLVGAVFNGDPAPPGSGDPQLRDAGGTAFRMDDHSLSFVELWYGVNQGDNAAGLPGTYKLGAYYDSAHFADQVFDSTGVPLASPASNGIARAHSGGWAIYGVVDQMLWRKSGTKDRGIGGFLLAMGAPGSDNLVNVFIEGGINWKGMIPGRENDTFGLGVAYLGISPAARQFSRDLIAYTGSGTVYASNETVLEATYTYQIAPWWTMQPDIQYVINPGANIPSAYTTKALKNAFVAGVRATVTF